ncbi:MAG: ATPase, partial [Candidatus Rokubacteria bacterium]|nr:ATPase [Candidatus Rokubacteria bacterium]
MLFADSEVFGTFKGFNERGLEFAAEIVSPYDASMLDRPQLGQFLLIELGSQEEAALGRITRFVPAGLLAGPEGEDYVNTMQRRQSPVPEDL